MSHWWRAYDEALDDPKLQRLPAELFRAWFNVMCITSRNGGMLPPTADIAFALRTTPDKAHRVIGALRAVGLIDEDETGLHPHNWNARQFKTDVSTERVKRFRKRHETVSRNAPDTETEQIQSSEAKASGAQAPPPTDEKQLYDRGKVVLGTGSGGLIKRLLLAKQGNMALARSAIETASTKSDPREYIGGILRGANGSQDSFLDPTAGIL